MMFTLRIAIGNPGPLNRTSISPTPKRAAAPIAPPKATERKVMIMAASVARCRTFVKLRKLAHWHENRLFSGQSER